jgi:molybdate transport system regulatory protein
MNRFFGTVLGLETSGEISLVDVGVGGAIFTSLVLETENSSAYLKPGTKVTVLFKESEVALATGDSLVISIRNQIKCQVASVEAEGLLAHITLSFSGKMLHALITARAARQLDLVVGTPVYALIKSTDVSLAAGYEPE